MNRSFRFERLFKVLAGLCIGISLHWLWRFLVPWLGPSESTAELAFAAVMGTLLSIPGFLGCYFGFQGLRKTDAATVKRLLGSYCLFLALSSASHVSVRMDAFGQLSEAATQSIIYLSATVVAMIVYWFTSRYCLRLLGHQCSPVRQSLSRAPFALIALQVQQTIQGVLLDKFPDDGSYGSMRTDAPFATSIILGVVVYKLGVWLFVAQGSTAEEEMAAEPPAAPSAEA